MREEEAKVEVKQKKGASRFDIEDEDEDGYDAAEMQRIQKILNSQRKL